MKKGTRVRIADNHMAQAWGQVGQLGTVAGPDPEGDNKQIVSVKMGNGFGLFEIKGVNVAHLELVEKGG